MKNANHIGTSRRDFTKFLSVGGACLLAANMAQGAESDGADEIDLDKITLRYAPQFLVKGDKDSPVIDYIWSMQCPDTRSFYKEVMYPFMENNQQYNYVFHHLPRHDREFEKTIDLLSVDPNRYSELCLAINLLQAEQNMRVSRNKIQRIKEVLEIKQDEGFSRKAAIQAIDILRNYMINDHGITETPSVFANGAVIDGAHKFNLKQFTERVSI